MVPRVAEVLHLGDGTPQASGEWLLNKRTDVPIWPVAGSS